jgi:hypothetical protein
MKKKPKTTRRIPIPRFLFSENSLYVSGDFLGLAELEDSGRNEKSGYAKKGQAGSARFKKLNESGLPG